MLTFSTPANNPHFEQPKNISVNFQTQKRNMGTPVKMFSSAPPPGRNGLSGNCFFRTRINLPLQQCFSEDWFTP